MTKNREYFMGYDCPNCGEGKLIISGPMHRFCDVCGFDLQSSLFKEKNIK
ncbi:hypothetical protein KA005_76670 [bacterium]|nr:hypothetical protein [bacterium]